MRLCLKRISAIALSAFLSTMLVACGSAPRKEALTSTQLQMATIDGFSGIRYVPSTQLGTSSFLDELKVAIPKRGSDAARASNYLSLSGGATTVHLVQVC